MPEAPHHEMQVVPMEGSKYKCKVVCTGCNFQSHLLPEEDPQGAINIHQQRYGYRPKAKKEEPKAEVKTEPKGPNSFVPTVSGVKPVQMNTQKIVTSPAK